MTRKGKSAHEASRADVIRSALRAWQRACIAEAEARVASRTAAVAALRAHAAEYRAQAEEARAEARTEMARMAWLTASEPDEDHGRRVSERKAAEAARVAHSEGLAADYERMADESEVDATSARTRLARLRRELRDDLDYDRLVRRRLPRSGPHG